MSRKRKKNAILTSFVAHGRDMRESIAWAALPDNARRVLDRLELEHMRHGGAENGALPCTYTDFEKAGLRRASVSLAIRQCICLGFVRITRQGHKSAAGFHAPSLYQLTYVHGTGKSPDPTHDWKQIATDDSAKAALQHAAESRNRSTQPRSKNQKPGRVSAPEPDAVARLQRGVSRTR